MSAEFALPVQIAIPVPMQPLASYVQLGITFMLEYVILHVLQLRQSRILSHRPVRYVAQLALLAVPMELFASLAQPTIYFSVASAIHHAQVATLPIQQTPSVLQSKRQVLFTSPSQSACFVFPSLPSSPKPSMHIPTSLVI